MKPKRMINLIKYSGEWVALSEDETKVMGHNVSLEEAYKEAQKNGEKNPVVISAVGLNCNMLPSCWYADAEPV